jgi:3-deoxy-D-manno-octulosonic-acid transferase
MGSLRASGLDLCYAIAAIATSPVWLLRMWRTGKIRTDWSARLGRGEGVARTGRPRIMLHAVSVGEVNAIRLLVRRLEDDPVRPEIFVATTTDTGFARASELFPGRTVRYPFDFSFAVGRLLDRLRPDVVGLVELEVWPNFTGECRRRGIAVAVVNGRLSERSFRRYRKVRALVAPSFRRLAASGVQTDDYAARFRALSAGRVETLGTMKWDTAEIADSVAGADDLARELGIDRSRPLVVAGSTAPGEPELLDAALPEGVQLLVAPRKPEWFEAAAAALPGCVRRSERRVGSATGRFVLDTIGELRKAYALADVVVVGRSFGDLHGSDMSEPIALGKATLIGPRSGDFVEQMAALRKGGGIVETSRESLRGDLARLLGDTSARRGLADRGRAIIRDRQGATERYARLLLSLLPAGERRA